MNVFETKLRSALGFAMKAGKVAAGEFAVDKALKSGAARLIVVDGSASANTKKQWTDACTFRRIPLIIVNDMGHAIGKPNRMAAAITDENFSDMILKAYASCISAQEGGAGEGKTTEAMTDE